MILKMEYIDERLNDIIKRNNLFEYLIVQESSPVAIKGTPLPFGNALKGLTTEYLKLASMTPSFDRLFYELGAYERTLEGLKDRWMKGRVSSIWIENIELKKSPDGKVSYVYNYTLNQVGQEIFDFLNLRISELQTAADNKLQSADVATKVKLAQVPVPAASQSSSNFFAQVSAASQPKASSAREVGITVVTQQAEEEAELAAREGAFQARRARLVARSEEPSKLAELEKRKIKLAAEEAALDIAERLQATELKEHDVVNETVLTELLCEVFEIERTAVKRMSANPMQNTVDIVVDDSFSVKVCQKIIAAINDPQNNMTDKGITIKKIAPNTSQYSRSLIGRNGEFAIRFTRVELAFPYEKLQDVVAGFQKMLTNPESKSRMAPR